MNHIQTGRYGEDVVRQFLQVNGHEILKTNYRFRRGEIDLVTLHRNELIFVEVKTRRSNQRGSAALSVHQKKQRQLIAAANAYIREHGRIEDARFDVVLLSYENRSPGIEHIQHAFYPSLR